MYLLPLLFMGICSPASAGALFDDQAVLEVELIGPLDSVIGSKPEREEHPFLLRVDGHELPLDVRLRGKSRLEHCPFPPLRLDFDRSATGQTAFEGQDVLKLVTHCINSDSGELNLLEEYLAYRIFNLLSDFSFRVRLLHITYTDTDGRLDRDAHRRYAFVIEPAEQLAARLKAVPLDIEGVSLRRLNSDQAARVYVFQYLVGNTDWSLVHPSDEKRCCHNGDLFERDEKIFYLPYDFDQAGIVNARYAKPHPVVHIPNVRVRRYRGYCTDTEALESAIRHVNVHQGDIIELVRGTPGLSERDAQKTIDYLRGYFDKSENVEKLLKKFERQCIGG